MWRIAWHGFLIFTFVSGLLFAEGKVVMQYPSVLEQQRYLAETEALTSPKLMPYVLALRYRDPEDIRVLLQPLFPLVSFSIEKQSYKNKKQN